MPFAEYVTIVRSPVSHFRSSFKYWQIAESIARRGGPPGVTPESFLADHQSLEPMSSNVHLIHNSFAFDFGLAEKAVADMRGREAAVADFLASMDERFTTVLITEYFAESLLILKREMCWQLDDVVYGAMKVSEGGWWMDVHCACMLLAFVTHTANTQRCTRSERG